MGEAMTQKPNDREIEIRMMTTRCRHFTGAHQTCAANLDPRAVTGGADLGWVTRMPCHQVIEPKNGERAICQSYAPWTREEAERRVDRSTAQRDALFSAYAVLKADAAAKGLRKGNGGSGSVDCPACHAGTVKYTIAGSNGHMWARCSNGSCNLRFME